VKGKFINTLQAIAAGWFRKTKEQSQVKEATAETYTYKTVLRSKMQSVKSGDLAYRSISAVIH
jgi:hypothetical protein